MLFFADTCGVFDVYCGSHHAAVRYAIQFPLHDPMPLVPVIARVTHGLGVGVTSSTSFVPPYYAARLFSTLDHLSEGRFAWNVVASYGRNPAANFGMSEEFSKEERYARAEEYMQVCYKLWRSWDPDSLLMDRESLIFADPEKVRKINHRGRYFNVEGPLNVAPSPQGWPVIIQAGASAPGLAFAGRHAEVHFATSASVKGMSAHRARLNEAVRAAGRQPEEVKILWATSIFLGETRREAEAKEAALRDRVPLEGGLAMMSGHFGVDFSKMPLDEPLGDLGLEETLGLQGVADMLLRDFSQMTLRDVAMLYGNGMGGLRVVGSPAEVADRLEEAFEAADGDGFMLRCGVLPGSIDDVVELLVPELQARRRFRVRYEGRTLRENLMEE